MIYSVDSTAKLPAYIQIYQYLKEDIVKGVYPRYSKIPSKRILAAETGVSVITIKHALELLCDEGYIEAKQRSGYFVIFTKDDFLGSDVTAGDTAIGRRDVMSETKRITGDSSCSFPFTVIARTMRKVILDYEDKLLVKSHNQGCEYLRDEICAYLARSRAIYVKPSQVIVGSGAEYLYGLIAQMFTMGTKFAIENPSYEKIEKVYAAFKVPYEKLSLGQEGISTADLMTTEAAVLHTTPFNSYPSGITISSSKKHEYLSWADSRKGYIIEDNYDSELTVSRKPEDSLFTMSNGHNVIYINTFSRTISPAIRIGYMILPEEMMDVYKEKLGFYSCTVPVFDQYVLAEILHNGDYERHINRQRRKRRNIQNA